MMMKVLRQQGRVETDGRRGRRHHLGFSLIELLVVIAIVGIILAVSLPAMSALSRGNNVKQGGNMVTAYLASARAAALASKRHVGVVFYEQSGTTTSTFNKNQTVVQLAIEDADQGQYSLAGYTVFVPYSAVQFLPMGVRVATLTGLTGAGSSVSIAGNSGSNSVARAVVFNGEGQMEVVMGLSCSSNTGAAYIDTPAGIMSDWNFIQVAASPAPVMSAISSPGVMLFDGGQYTQQVFGSDGARATWIQKNADIIVVNSYTGNVIR